MSKLRTSSGLNNVIRLKIHMQLYVHILTTVNQRGGAVEWGLGDSASVPLISFGGPSDHNLGVQSPWASRGIPPSLLMYASVK